MSFRPLFIFLLLLFLSFLGFAEKASFEKVSGQNFADSVVILSIGEKTLLTKQSFQYMEKILLQAERQEAKAVVFDIHTPGGLAWETSELMEILAGLKIPSYAFVNTKALSAGALIAMSTDQIYMRPVSVIGAAGIVSGNGKELDPVLRAKLDSSFDAFARSVIRKKGHHVEVVRAMMFKDEEFSFSEIQVKKGSLLTLTSEEAILKWRGKNLLAKGIVSSLEEVLEKENLSTFPVIYAHPTGFLKLAQWVEYISPFLIMLGIAGVYFEIKTPGLGIGAVIGLGAFGIFFFGNHIAGNLAGYELFFAFSLCLVLLFLDIFFLGVGFLAFLSGLLLIFIIVSSMLTREVFEFLFSGNFAAFWESLTLPLLSLFLGLIGGFSLIFFSLKYIKYLPFFNQVVMSKMSNLKITPDSPRDLPLIGKIGDTISDFKPSGKISVDGVIYDAKHIDGKFLEKGIQILVVRKSDWYLLVEEKCKNS